MDGDEWATLAVRAAATGRLDFSESWPRESKWYFKEKFIIDSMRVEDAIKLREMLYARGLAGMQYIELVPGGKLLDDAYVQNYKEASVQYAHVGKLMRPWDKEWARSVEDLEASMSGTLSVRTMAELIKNFRALKKAWEESENK